MSTPYNGGNDPRDYEPYPEHPLGSHPENEVSNTPGYEAYPGTDYTTGAYPSDSYDAFEVNSAAAAAGASALRFHGQQLTDNIPGDGQTPHPINDPESNGWFHTKGTGKLKVFEAIGWAFKAVFANPKVWLLIGLVYLLVSGGMQFIPGVGGAVGSLGMLLLAPYVAGIALQETLAKQFTFGEAKAPAYGRTIGMYALIGFVTSALLAIVFGIFAVGALAGIDLNSLPQNPEELTEMPPEELIELFAPLLGAMGGTALIALLLGPFVAMQVWYAADNNGTFGEAFAAGFKAGARNYLPLIGLSVMSVLIALVGTLLLGVGLIVALPVITLAMAHAYRQISAGPVPQDATL